MIKSIIKAGMLGTTALVSVAVPGVASARTSDVAAGSMNEAAEGVADDAAGTNEIIVSARRKAESLQDVPQTVNAVTGDAIEKLNVTQFAEVDSLVPGLSLESAGTGFTFGATLRGVSFNTISGPPNIQFYLNDAAVEQAVVFQSMYDIGQVEVLRGPQGTLRGRASPSGAITLATRKPDLDEVGGFAMMSGTENQIYASGAINVPIVSGVAALRIAGVVDHNDADEVRSINGAGSPYSNTESVRVSLKVEPSADVTANVMYQYLQNKTLTWPGAESIRLSQPTAPLGWGDTRIISAADRLSVSKDPNTLDEKQHLVTGSLDWRFGGHQLSYVGGYLDVSQKTRQPQDQGAIFPARTIVQSINPPFHAVSQELRLSSTERVAGMFDYTVGGLYYQSKTGIDGRTPLLAAGSFGAPPGTPGMPMVFGQGESVVRINQRATEKSLFGNVIAYLGESTELSAGLRHIWYSDRYYTFLVSAFGQPQNRVLQDARSSPEATIYNVSLKHRFNDDLMIYANTGTAWRQGAANSLFTGRRSPRLTQFLFQDPEKSTSYEVGLKASAFDKRLTFDIAVYHQKFKNFLYVSPGQIFYVEESLADGSQTVKSSDFRTNVPAEVTGGEAQLGFRPNSRLSLDAIVSYSKGKIKNGVVPCNPPGGTPTSPSQITGPNNGELIFQCTTNDRLSTAPNLSFNFQGEYAAPVFSGAEGFVRGLLQYSGNNPNDPSNPFDSVSRYALLNLYLGLRSEDGRWEVSAFGKNVTNAQRTLSRSDAPFTVGSVLGQTFASNYVSVSRTRPREFGLSVRYAFGSR